jgi:hypothetical protein
MAAITRKSLLGAIISTILISPSHLITVCKLMKDNALAWAYSCYDCFGKTKQATKSQMLKSQLNTWCQDKQRHI